MVVEQISYFLSQLINGLIISSLYALMAIGLTLIFGIMKIVNFAHGEMYMIGGYTAYFIIARLGLHPAFGVVAAIIVGFIFGMLVEKVFLRPIGLGKVENPDEYSILITFALSIFFRNLMIVIYPFSTGPPSYLNIKVHVGELVVSGDRLLAAGISGTLIGIFIIFLYKTWYGRALRAVSQNRDSASAVGINPSTVDSIAFGLGSMMASAAGALIAPIFLVSPSMGALPAIKGYVIIVLGGMGSIRGSIIGSILLGMIESLGSAFIPDPTRALAYKDVYGLLVLIAVLLIRPWGLFGERVREA